MTHYHGVGRVMNGTTSQGEEEGRTCPLMCFADCERPKERRNYLASIASSGEDISTMESLPPIKEKVL